MDHGLPTCRELVEVPTLFYNESISHSGEFMAHVDLLPTIKALTESWKGPRQRFAGYDLVSGAPEDRQVVNHVERPNFEEISVWDRGGAHVSTRDTAYERFRLAIRLLHARATAPHNRRHPVQVMKTLLERNRTIGLPITERSKAQDIIDRKRTEAQTESTRSLDEKAIERLVDLGYHEGEEI